MTEATAAAAEHHGGCLCGDVRYAVSGPSVWSAICYCNSCTRASGGLAVGWAGFAPARFRLLKGEMRLFESTPGVRRGFCPRCGTSLTYQKDPAKLPGAQDHIYITARTLDDPSAYPPEEHVLYGERVPWFHISDDLPRHDGLSVAHADFQLQSLRKD